MVAWPMLGGGPTYVVSGVRLDLTIALAAVVLGLLGGVLGGAIRWAMTAARTHAPTGPRAIATIALTFLALGFVAIPAPQLLGNGKNVTQLVFDGTVPLGVAALMTIAKPLATAACLRSGAIGGILTPAFTTGATLGLTLALGLPDVIPRADAATLALVGAGAVLAVAQRAAFTAVALAIELAHAPLVALVPVAIAVVVAVATARVGESAVRGRQAALRPIGCQA